MTRPCYKCGEDRPDNFYASIKKWCKTCWAERVRINRCSKIEQYRSYDRSRAFRDDRVFARKQYQEDKKHDPVAKEKAAARRAAYIERNAEKKAAHTLVGNYVRDGKLNKKPCEVCGATNKVHAHHDDYSKPLDVIWLCPEHHGKRHRWLNEQARNKAKE